MPYLVSVPDPYDVLSPYHDWGPVPITATTLAKALKLTGPITDVTTTPNPAGRVGTAEPVDAARRRRPSPATTLARRIGLRSTWFTVGVLSLTPPPPTRRSPTARTVTLAGVVRGFAGATLEQRPLGRHVAGGRAVATGAVTAARDADDHDRLPARDGDRRRRLGPHQGRAGASR